MTDVLQPGTNTGVLIRPTPRSTDWRAGGESGVVKKVLEPSGRWGIYLPDEEAQAQWSTFADLFLDTSGCVTFSGTNDIEALLTRMRALGELPATHEKFLQDAGYINKASGKVNVSDRFSAKMSGTTKAGNYLEAVGDSFRNHGLLPESDWQWPDMSDLVGTSQEMYDARFARYYEEIPVELKEKALEFRKYFEIKYEWVLLGAFNAAKLQDALRYGPVQIAAAVCSPWSSNDGMPPIPACGCNTQHATLIYGRREDGAWEDFDHYKSFRKLLAPDYCIQWAMQYFIEAKVPTAPATKPVPPSVSLYRGMPASPAVKQLQLCLQYLKDPATSKPYMQPGLFGAYGPSTQAACARFQVVKGIADTPQGFHYGPKTRAALAAELAKI